MTGTLTVKYRSPTPLHEPSCTSSAGSAGSRAARSSPRAPLYAGERLCAEAEGIFISIDPTKFRDLIDQRAEAEQERLAGRPGG